MNRLFAHYVFLFSLRPGSRLGVLLVMTCKYGRQVRYYMYCSATAAEVVEERHTGAGNVTAEVVDDIHTAAEVAAGGGLLTGQVVAATHVADAGVSEAVTQPELTTLLCTGGALLMCRTVCFASCSRWQSRSTTSGAPMGLIAHVPMSVLPVLPVCCDVAARGVPA